LGNQLTLTDDVKIGFYDFMRDSDYLMMAWTHVLEEFVLRGYHPPAPLEGKLDDIQIPKYDWPGVRKAVKQIRSFNYSKDGALFKYGKEEYLRPMVEAGLPVTYIDPFGDYKSEPDVYFSKHFRYGYQKEFRLVWLPPAKTDLLDPVFLEIGSMEDYCHLITLEKP